MSQATRRTGVPRQSATTAAPTPSAWVGWVVFAAVMMILLGSFHVVQGLVALLDDSYYLVGSEGLVVSVDWTVWGWTHLLLGALVVAAGAGLLSGRTWARAVTVVLALMSALVNVAFLAAYPVWSTIMIAVDVLVIWAVTVHGDELSTRR